MELYNKWQNRWNNAILEGFIFQLISINSRYGGEIVEMSQITIGQEIKVPTVYAILKRSLEAGLLEVSDTDVEDGVTRGVKRKHYSLTTAGKLHFRAIMKQVEKLPQILEKDPKSEIQEA